MRVKRRSVSVVVLTLATMLTASVMAVGVSAAGPRGSAAAHGRYIVRAKTHADVAGLRQAARSAGAKIVNELSGTDSLVVTGSSSAASAIARQSGAATVVPDRVERIVPSEFAGENNIHKPFGHGGGTAVDPDPAFDLSGLLWDFDRIHAQKAWKTTTGRSSVLVGVADTGLDYTHAELASKVVGNVDLTDPTLCSDYFGYSDADASAEFGGPADTDWNGHGSWIGGDIAAALDGSGMNGIAPGVGLVALKIAEWCGYAYDSSILDAFTYAADNGIDVVSISFGGYLDRSDPEQDAIYAAYVDTVAYARSKGTVIVASAGNEHVRLGAGGRVISHGPLTIPGDSFDDYFGLYETPAGIPGVVAVSATGNVVKAASATCAAGTFESGDATCKPATDAHQPIGVGRQNQLTYYSNYGPRIDIAAPGGARKFNLPNADRGGTGGFPYTTADGTTAFETFSITSNWALEIPCFYNLGGPFPADQCYSTIQGTSMATPHVSATVALIASAHPWMAHRPILLIGYLKLTAQDIHGNKTPALSATDTSAGDRTGLACPTGYCHLGGPAISDQEAYGAGLVDAGAAVR